MSLSLFVRKAVICLVLALALPGVAPAQQVTFTNYSREYAIAGAQIGDQVHPSAAVSPVGGFVVWEDNGIDGYGTGIGAIALDSNFSPAGRRFRVNQIVGGDQALPQVALLHGGGAAFTWQGGAPSRQNIYARFLSSSNTWLTGDVLVNTFAPNFKRQPGVAVLSGGNVVIVWGSYNQQASDSLQDVYAQIFSPTGTKIGSEFLVNQFTLFNQRSPAIAPLSTGGFVIGWISELQTRSLFVSPDADYEYPPDDRPSVDLFARIFNDSGVAAGNEFQVNTNVLPCSAPAIAGGSDGGFIVTWAEHTLDTTTNGWDIMARSFSKDGVGGSLGMVNTYRLGDQFNPRIGSLGSDFLTVWTSMRQDGSWEGVYGRFLQADGTTNGPEFRVNSITAGSQMQPVIVSDNAERFLAVWTSFAGIRNGFDLAAQRFAPQGYMPSSLITSVYVAPASDPFAMILPPPPIVFPPVAPGGSTTVVENPAPTLDPLPPLLPLSGTAPADGLLKAQGAYNGLIYNTNVNVLFSGYFTAKTAASGSYSGKLLIAGRPCSISGKFSPATGLATNTVRLATGRTVALRLRLDLTGSDRMQGVLMDGQTYLAQIDADRLVWNQKSNPAPQRGSYTMAIRPGTSGPRGYGYGMVKVSPAGTIQMSGTLADGTKVSQSSAVSKDGLWPLYVSLYSGGGVAVSWMQFTNQPESDLDGQLVWIKLPGLKTKTYLGGFTNATSAVGSAYNVGGGRVLNLNNGDVIFSGGTFQAPLTNSFTLNAQNRVAPAAGSYLKLSFTPSSGLFQGSTKVADQLLSFQGVVYTKGTNGVGLFQASSQNGQVYLGASPAIQ